MEEIRRDPFKYERSINENMRSNGDRVWIDWTNKIVWDDQSKIIEILSIGSDITDRKRAEEALQKAHDELEQRVRERTAELTFANERLLELDRLKSQFLATMSHELRTPLNSIIGFTGILRQGFAGPVNEEQKKQLDMVYNSAKHLLSLILNNSCSNARVLPSLRQRTDFMP
jgi:signal transduction histidine kinase